MARRQVDDQQADLALPHRGEFGGDDLDVPVHRQVGLRVEVAKAALGEGGKILAERYVVLGRGQIPQHRLTPCRPATAA
jgi:hypothetical protein